MKNMTGFVIIDASGYPVCFNHQMPCYWIKKVALEEAKKHGLWRVTKVRLVLKMCE